MARPAIAAGVLLAIMETIADYGTVAYFNVRTFSTGIYQAWFAMQDRAAAAQLALCLLAFALVLAALERIQRGQARSHMRGGRLAGDRAAARSRAGAAGRRRALLRCRSSSASCCRSASSPPWRRAPSRASSTRATSRFVGNSLTLAGVAAVVTVAGAVLVGFRARLRPGRRVAVAVLGAGLGYAVPGRGDRRRAARALRRISTT